MCIFYTHFIFHLDWKTHTSIDNLSLDKLANMSSHNQFPWKRNEINKFDMLENKLNEGFNQFVLRALYGSLDVWFFQSK
jgi:hypothetical protein